MSNRGNQRRALKRDRKNSEPQQREEAAGRWSEWTETDGITINGTRQYVPVSASGFQKCFTNNRYTVLVRRIPDDAVMGGIVHLSIRRNDRGAARDWREFQRIKNELAGPELDAVEIYPAESKLVDAANQYHLWCFLNYRLPFGFSQRDVRGPEGAMFGATQRAFTED